MAVRRAARRRDDQLLDAGLRADGKVLVPVAAWRKPIGVCPLPEMDDELTTDVEPYRGTADTSACRWR
jgi:hypothetical protein